MKETLKKLSTEGKNKMITIDESKIREVVESAGGKYIGINDIMHSGELTVWFNDKTGSTRILLVKEFSYEAVRKRLC